MGAETGAAVAWGKHGAATVQVKLRSGQRIKAEPDALITCSQNVEVGAAMAGLAKGDKNRGHRAGALEIVDIERGLDDAVEARHVFSPWSRAGGAGRRAGRPLG